MTRNKGSVIDGLTYIYYGSCLHVMLYQIIKDDFTEI